MSIFYLKRSNAFDQITELRYILSLLIFEIISCIWNYATKILLVIQKQRLGPKKLWVLGFVIFSKHKAKSKKPKKTQNHILIPKPNKNPKKFKTIKT